jgi:endoglucanase
LDSTAKPFKRVTAQLRSSTTVIVPGDIARWALEKRDRSDSPKKGDRFDFSRVDRARRPLSLPYVQDGLLHTHACDDLAAVAAALATLDVLRNRNDARHVGLLLTRAEEVGFIGAIAACQNKSIPKGVRLICLENSRSFPESPIGAGPIVRVGDKMSVFDPALTNRISLLMMEHQKANPKFKWQRKLMPGGTCEATTFSAFGHQSTCLCLPLGNYHNMIDIDGVLADKRSAKIGPEFISIDDYHGLIQMLVLCATQLDSAKIPTTAQRMNGLLRDYGHVLGR